MLPPHRVALIVLDGVGCGALPDAADYGDAESDTLGHLAEQFPEGLRLPRLEALGLGHVGRIRGVAPRRGDPRARAAFGRCAEVSRGKDSTSGHWEIAGLILEQPFPVYPGGFPDEILRPFRERIGRDLLGNRAASGTAIIDELGEEHLRTGRPIVYTSADSVFQIAAHEAVCSTEELYRICRIARELLRPPHHVARVIARPFTGPPGAFRRTAARRDFSLPPPAPTLLDHCQRAGVRTVGVGKIGDLFAGRGLDVSIPTHGNAEGVEATRRALEREPGPALIFVNLVDFDTLYGHRNDCEGFRRALESFDAALPAIEAVLRPDDLLILTADHGNDPTTPSTDHSREYAPLLVLGRAAEPGRDLGTRPTLADVGQTAAHHLGLKPLCCGRSVLNQTGVDTPPRS